MGVARFGWGAVAAGLAVGAMGGALAGYELGKSGPENAPEAAAAPTTTALGAAAVTTTLPAPGLGGTIYLGPAVCEAMPTDADVQNPASQFYVSVNENTDYPPPEYNPGNLPGHGSILKGIELERGFSATTIEHGAALAIADAIGILTHAMQTKAGVAPNAIVTDPDNFPFDDWIVPIGCKVNGVRFS